MSYLNLKRTKHVIAGFGNPLIDISVVVEEETDIFKKFNLNPDGQQEVHCKQFNEILSSISSKNYNVSFNPGGCTQNTLRIIQSLVNYPSFSVFFGGVGSDQDGVFLESEVKKSGIDIRYTKHLNHSTGRVAALIKGENRSLIANLGAAEVYRLEDFMTTENLKIIAEVFIVYIEGFFITHSFDVCLKILNLCRKHLIVTVFNISGAYIAKSCPKELHAIAVAADIIIGNEGEFQALADIIGLNYDSVEDMALKVHSALWETKPLSQFKLVQMSSFGRTVVITRGKNSVVCINADKYLINYKVPFLDPTLVKDSTGAGDAFAAGFLVAFLEGKSAAECVSCGCEVAREVVQHIGVQLTDEGSA